MRIIPLLALACLAAGCASQIVPPESVPEVPRDAADSVEIDRVSIEKQVTAGTARDIAPTANELLLHAMGLVGVQYKLGGTSPDTGFDCSGLVYYLFGQVFGLYLPRTTKELSGVGDAVRAHDLEPGDLVFFNTLKRPFSHVGIYLGNRRFIHAPTHGGQVEVVDMTERYWKTRYNGARRVFY